MLPADRKTWRRDVKKSRRKRIRQAAAFDRLKRTATVARKTSEPDYRPLTAEEQEHHRAELESAEQNRLWLAYDKTCMDAWSERRAKEQRVEDEKQAERLRIQTEFEARERRKTEQRLERIRIANEKLQRFENLQLAIEDCLLNGAPLPDELLTKFEESNVDRELCRMFAKTGACRFGSKCTRNHRVPAVSRLLLVPGFFVHVLQATDGKASTPPVAVDLDDCTSEGRWQQSYVDFFCDWLPEMERLGRVTQFRVCRNRSAHLAGNLLVEFADERSALRALRSLNGRYYAGILLQPEFRTIESWRSAVCGLSIVNKCLKGGDCNFLHVFRNPGNRFPFTASDGTSCAGQTPRRSGQTPYVTKYGIDVLRPPMPLQWDDLDDLDKSTQSKPSASRSNQENWRWSKSPSPLRQSSRTRRETISDQQERDDRRSMSFDKRDSTRSSSRHSAEKYQSREDKNSEGHRRSRKNHKDRETDGKVRRHRESPRSSSRAKSTRRDCREYDSDRSQRRSHDRKSSKRSRSRSK